MENGSIGPPLRLKAVNTETGEASRSFSISWSGLSYINDEKDSMITDFSTPAIHLPGVSMSSIQLCQSTGLHDARGVEIFFGDVLYSIYDAAFIENNDLFAVEFKGADTVVQSIVYDYQTSLDSVVAKCMVVVGNRWQPREVLEQKGGEVKS